MIFHASMRENILHFSIPRLIISDPFCFLPLIPSALSAGLITGIVIAIVVVITVVILVVAWFAGARNAPKSSSTTADPFPTPTPPVGFDNALYETNVQVDQEKPKDLKDPGVAEA